MAVARTCAHECRMRSNTSSWRGRRGSCARGSGRRAGRLGLIGICFLDAARFSAVPEYQLELVGYWKAGPQLLRSRDFFGNGISDDGDLIRPRIAELFIPSCFQVGVTNAIASMTHDPFNSSGWHGKNAARHLLCVNPKTSPALGNSWSSATESNRRGWKMSPRQTVIRERRAGRTAPSH